MLIGIPNIADFGDQFEQWIKLNIPPLLISSRDGKVNPGVPHLTPLLLGLLGPLKCAISRGSVLIASFPASILWQIVTPSGRRMFYTTFAESWFPLKNSSKDNASGGLTLIFAFSMSYVDELGSLSDNLVTNSVLQRNSEHSSIRNSRH